MEGGVLYTHTIDESCTALLGRPPLRLQDQRDITPNINCGSKHSLQPLMTKERSIKERIKRKHIYLSFSKRIMDVLRTNERTRWTPRYITLKNLAYDSRSWMSDVWFMLFGFASCSLVLVELRSNMEGLKTMIPSLSIQYCLFSC